MTLDFAIIGGGLTGTSMLHNLVDRVKQAFDKGCLHPTELKVQVFEKQAVFGPGLPHSDRYMMPFHITNMCAEQMSIVQKKPLDFHHWASRNQDIHRNRLPHLSASFISPGFNEQTCTHYPRAFMGEYLKAKFTEAVQIARKIGLQVELFSNSEVTNLKEHGGKVHLTVQDSESGTLRSVPFDRILLAPGHWFEQTEKDRFFPSPWPARNLLDNIPPGEQVAVIGSSRK